MDGSTALVGGVVDVQGVAARGPVLVLVFARFVRVLPNVPANDDAHLIPSCATRAWACLNETCDVCQDRFGAPIKAFSPPKKGGRRGTR